MRLIIAIVQDYDCDRMLRSVTGAGFRATKISSSGGFLRTGNTTVLLGVEKEHVAECLRLIEMSCRSRTDAQLDSMASEYIEWFPSGFHEVVVGGAVVFIAHVARYERLEPSPESSPKTAAVGVN